MNETLRSAVIRSAASLFDGGDDPRGGEYLRGVVGVAARLLGLISDDTPDLQAEILADVHDVSWNV